MSLIEITQVIGGISSLILTIPALVGMYQIFLLRRNNQLEFIKKTRGEWLNISKILIDNPLLVPTYAPREANEFFAKYRKKPYYELILKKYAFADYFFELLAQHYYIEKKLDSKKMLSDIYPDNIIVPDELKKIWNSWGLKEDHSIEFQEYIKNKISPNS